LESVVHRRTELSGKPELISVSASSEPEQILAVVATRTLGGLAFRPDEISRANELSAPARRPKVKSSGTLNLIGGW
jgi:hypothetical protein